MHELTEAIFQYEDQCSIYPVCHSCLALFFCSNINNNYCWGAKNTSWTSSRSRGQSLRQMNTVLFLSYWQWSIRDNQCQAHKHECTHTQTLKHKGFMVEIPFSQFSFSVFQIKSQILRAFIKSYIYKLSCNKRHRFFVLICIIGCEV